MTAEVAAGVSAYIGLGSNLDDPRTQLEVAMFRLGELPETELGMRSSVYRSAPYGGVEQPDFVNAVVMIVTRLPALVLLDQLLDLERELGRRRDGSRWGPRVIDLDLLIYGDAIINKERLTVPHPGIAERNFVLLPLREVAPDLVVPGLGPVANIAVADEPRIERMQ